MLLADNLSKACDGNDDEKSGPEFEINIIMKYRPISDQRLDENNEK